MATNVRGRSGYRFSSTSGQTAYPRSGQDGWDKTSEASRRGTRKTTTGPNAMRVPSGYKVCSSAFWNKVNSFRMLYKQTCGPAKHTRPSPATLNTFANWINKGAIVHNVTTAQISRWAKTTDKTFNTRKAGPTTCKNVLCAKFGKNTIKAVCRTKAGSYMVVTPATVSGKQFQFPK